MLSHELAKKLKYAGFPQELKDGTYIDGEQCCDVCGNSVRIPTLSELLESCGLGVILSHHESGWTIRRYTSLDDVIAELEWFDTPEEAVAYLWLELNK